MQAPVGRIRLQSIMIFIIKEGLRSSPRGKAFWTWTFWNGFGRM